MNVVLRIIRMHEGLANIFFLLLHFGKISLCLLTNLFSLSFIPVKLNLVSRIKWPMV
jgi:hypothetical protein